MSKYIPKPFTVLLGKAVKQAAKLRGGGGSALPGLFVEKIDPSFVPNTLATLPKGVIVISGTNGKTTTTKIVVSLLESQGLTVFTNKTGSNFVRGVAAALLSDMTSTGKLKADIAVLELDEAHAVKFVEKIKPTYSLILNVLRDQLDRFGEIDTTRSFLEDVVKNTTDSVVLNGADARIASLATSTHADVVYFDLHQSQRHHFPDDDTLHDSNDQPSAQPDNEALVTLQNFSKDTAEFLINGTSFSTSLKLTGAYNIFNSAAALALTLSVLPDANIPSLLTQLSTIEPAFGRGEVLTIEGQPLELVLVKNPSGFRLGLSSYSPNGYATLIVINDNYADGRDMSWLWDVDFSSLKGHPVATAGIRADDMALRLHYNDVPQEFTTQDPKKALREFLARHKNQPKRIYCTYTAMLALRKELSTYTKVENVL